MIMITYKPAANILFWLCLVLLWAVGNLANAVLERDEKLIRFQKVIEASEIRALKEKAEASEMYEELNRLMEGCLLSEAQLKTETQELNKDLSDCEEKIPTL